MQKLRLNWRPKTFHSSFQSPEIAERIVFGRHFWAFLAITAVRKVEKYVEVARYQRRVMGLECGLELSFWETSKKLLFTYISMNLKQIGTIISAEMTSHEKSLRLNSKSVCSWVVPVFCTTQISAFLVNWHIVFYYVSMTRDFLHGWVKHLAELFENSICSG